VFQSLPDDQTVRRWLEKQAAVAPGPMIKTQEVLDLAGTFLFRGDDVDKSIRVLSGGERSRLLLCGLLLGRYACLLLDEPTNHLDFETVEALADALRTYTGTLFVVSHDRTFIDRLATHVIEVKDGRATMFPDGYAAYCWRLEQEANAETGAPAAPSAAPSAAAPVAKRSASAQDTRDAGKRLKGVERDLKKLDERKKALETQLAATYAVDPAKELAEVTARIGQLEEEWLALSEIVNA
jgi:ATP-binding cassette subfamily F protein 3